MSEQYTSATPNSQEAQPADPSVVNVDIATPFDREAYNQKIDFFENALKKETDADLAAQCAVLVKAFGGTRKVESVDVWEAAKKQEANHLHDQISKLLAAEALNVTKPDEEKDIFDKVTSLVTQDIKGDPIGANRLRVRADIVDFNVGSELDGLVDTNELEDPEVLAKAMKTIHLLVVDGLYKLNKWGYPAQLKTALQLVETYTEYVPGFNPREAGYDEARAGLTMALAALQTDQKSKPNTRHAKPERENLFSQTENGLKQLRRTKAHIFARFQSAEQ